MSCPQLRLRASAEPLDSPFLSLLLTVRLLGHVLADLRHTQGITMQSCPHCSLYKPSKAECAGLQEMQRLAA